MIRNITIGAVVLFLLLVISVVYFSRSGGVLNQEDAINTVIARYPSLAAYRTTSLPPSEIVAKQAAGGWYVGFIQSGSGLPRILHAECYLVSTTGDVTATGIYDVQRDTTALQIVSGVAPGVVLENCAPVFVTTTASTSPDVSGTPNMPTVPTVPTPPSSPVVPPSTSELQVYAYGDVTLELNQRAKFKSISIRPVAIEEDSRCPADVQCIWAGRVRVKVEVVSGMGTSTGILTEGEAYTTEAESITLTSVTPATNSKVTITESDYRFIFNVVLR